MIRIKPEHHIVHQSSGTVLLTCEVSMVGVLWESPYIVLFTFYFLDQFTAIFIAFILHFLSVLGIVRKRDMMFSNQCM